MRPGSATFTNQGTVEAKNGGTLTINPSGARSNAGMISANAGMATLQGGFTANTGRVEAANTTVIIAPTGAWTNSAGTIALTNATLNLGGTLDATGGIGTFSNTASTVNVFGTINNAGNLLTFNNATGSWTLTGGTLSGGTLGFADGKTLLIGESNLFSRNLLTGVAVNGDLSLNASGSATRIAGGTTFSTAHLANTTTSLGFAPGQTLTGTILLEGAPTGPRYVEMNGTSGSFTIGSTGVIRTESNFGGNGGIGFGAFFAGTMALTNQGLISSQTSGRSIAIRPGTVINQGTVEAKNGGTLSITPSNAMSGYVQTAGVTRVADDSTISIDSSNFLDLQGGCWRRRTGCLPGCAGDGWRRSVAPCPQTPQAHLFRMALRAWGWHGAAERPIHRASAHRDREDAETAAALAEPNRDGRPFCPDAFASSPRTQLRQKTWRDNLAAMSTTLTPLETKRPALHKLIDELPAEALDLAERVLARLEMDRLWQQVREGFTQDWAEGKYARLDEVIREVRADLKQRAT